MRKRWHTPLVIVLAVCFTTILSGSAPPEDDIHYVSAFQPGMVSFPEKSFFHIEHSGDIHEPNRWLVVLEVPPPDLPGAVGARINQMIVLRGVDVPVSGVWQNNHAPPLDKDRHRSKSARGKTFVWSVCQPNNMRYSWIENPDPSDDLQALIVDVKYRRGDAVIDMAQAMIELGYAKVKGDDPYNWGTP